MLQCLQMLKILLEALHTKLFDQEDFLLVKSS